jgi:hypothetical protein
VLARHRSFASTSSALHDQVSLRGMCRIPKRYAASRSRVVAALAASNCKHGRPFLAAFALGSGQIDGLKPTSSKRLSLIEENRETAFCVISPQTTG